MQGLSITNIREFGWENAIMGMRLPKDSEGKSDSNVDMFNNLVLGDKDKDLFFRLIKAGRSHRKMLRMIYVQALVAMPLSWWAQYDTYKVGTVAISRSRMHKFGVRPLTEADFYISTENKFLSEIIFQVNKNLELYRFYKEDSLPIEAKIYWKKALDILPVSYIQERMISLNYEVLLAIALDRYNEKLKEEWNFFIDTFFKSCHYLSFAYNAVINKENKK